MAQGGQDLRVISAGQLRSDQTDSQAPSQHREHSSVVKELPLARPVQQRVMMKGVLQKRGKRLKGWHQRYFEIQGRRMLYYKNSTKKECLGDIDLSLCVKCTAVNEVGPGALFKIVTTIRTHVLCAKNAQHRDQWMRVIKSLIKPESERKVTMDNTKQRRRSLQPQQNPAPEKPARRNSFLERFRLRRTHVSAPNIITSEPAAPRVRDRPVSLAVYQIPEEEPEDVPQTLPSRSLPSTPVLEKRSEDVRSVPLLVEERPEVLHVEKSGEDVKSAPLSEEVREEVASMPLTEKQQDSDDENYNPPDFSAFDLPASFPPSEVAVPAPEQLPFPSDVSMDEALGSMIDKLEEEMNSEPRVENSEEACYVPPDFSAFDKPISFPPSDAVVPTSDEVVLPGGLSTDETMSNIIDKLEDEVMSVPPLEEELRAPDQEKGNYDPPDFSAFDDPLSFPLGDVVAPAAGEITFPVDISTEDRAGCLILNQIDEELVSEPIVEKLSESQEANSIPPADFSAFDEPIPFPSSDMLPGLERGHRLSIDETIYLIDKIDEQVGSTLPNEKQPSKEMSFIPIFDDPISFPLGDVGMPTEEFAFGGGLGMENTEGSIIDHIEDVLSQGESSIAGNTDNLFSAFNQIVPALDTNTEEIQLPAAIEGGTCTWDKIRKMLEGPDKTLRPQDLDDAFPEESQEWRKHTSAIEQLRAFLEACD